MLVTHMYYTTNHAFQMTIRTRLPFLRANSFKHSSCKNFVFSLASWPSAGSSICKGVTDYDGVVRDVQRSKGMPR